MANQGARDEAGRVRAEELWYKKNALAAGELVVQSVDPQGQPRWATRILRFAIEKSGVRFAPVDEAVRLGGHPAEWSKAHQAFDVLRGHTLKAERSGLDRVEDRVFYILLLVAENAAKVIFNATSPIAPFDEDSGAWLVSNLRDFVDIWNDDSISAEAWDIVCE